MRFLNYKIYYFRFPLKAYRLLGLRKYLRFVAGEREPIQKALKYHFFFPGPSSLSKRFRNDAMYNVCVVPSKSNPPKTDLSTQSAARYGFFSRTEKEPIVLIVLAPLLYPSRAKTSGRRNRIGKLLFLPSARRPLAQ